MPFHPALKGFYVVNALQRSAIVGTREEIKECRIDKWRKLFEDKSNGILEIANRLRKQEGLLELSASCMAYAMEEMCDFEQREAFEAIELERLKSNG